MEGAIDQTVTTQDKPPWHQASFCKCIWGAPHHRSVPYRPYHLDVLYQLYVAPTNKSNMKSLDENEARGESASVYSFNRPVRCGEIY